MIALWMVYMLSAGTLIALACHLVEPLARGAGRGARGVWASGMVLVLVAGAVALRPPGLQPDDSVTVTRANDAPAEGSIGEFARPSERSAWTTLAARLQAQVAGTSRAINQRAADAARRLAPLDRPLLALWLLATTVLAALAIRAALVARRLRHGLERREIAGAPVMLTEDLGPSAIGTRDGVILLPRWALELDDALLRLVVRHEREHLEARDPLLLLAALGAVLLLPWELPLWWCWRRLRLAIEMDCDRRVLREQGDVRRYAQLLLLTTQRAHSGPHASRSVMTVVAPLQPNVPDLGRRILAMTEPRTVRSPRRTALVTAVASVILGAAFVLPAPRLARAQRAPAAERAIVHITSVGLADVGPSPVILVYTSGGGRAGLGLESPKALTDTLRLDHLPAMTLDVTDGEVQLQLLGPGQISVGGTVTGGPSVSLSGSGRHITLLRGGTGIETK